MYVYQEDKPQSQEAGRPSVQLSGTDGNIFALMGECKKAMSRYQREIDPKYNANLMFQEMWDEVNQGDYNNALQVMMGFCDAS